MCAVFSCFWLAKNRQRTQLSFSNGGGLIRYETFLWLSVEIMTGMTLFDVPEDYLTFTQLSRFFKWTWHRLRPRKPTIHSPGRCSCWVPLWWCCAGFAKFPHSDNCQPCCDATPARFCPSTPPRNVWTPGMGWASGSNESASRRRTVSRTAATLAGPVLARVLCWLPPTHVSVGQAGGASQCSSGTFRSHQPALGQSPGSAAGKTGTPLLHKEEIQSQFKGVC